MEGAEGAQRVEGSLWWQIDLSCSHLCFGGQASEGNRATLCTCTGSIGIFLCLLVTVSLNLRGTEGSMSGACLLLTEVLTWISNSFSQGTTLFLYSWACTKDLVIYIVVDDSGVSYSGLKLKDSHINNPYKKAKRIRDFSNGPKSAFVCLSDKVL